MLQREPGADRVAKTLASAHISSVNWSEVVQKALATDTPTEGMRAELEALGLTILSFDADDAELVARLWTSTRRLGLSLGDRACIATGLRRKARVLTAERAWTKFDLGVRIETIRG